jgi:hypothetical protein
MSQTWREIEVDFLLSTSSRAKEIFQGGSPWTHRVARQAEMELTRSALMTGMLYRRLNGTDSAGADGAARIVEDKTNGVEWEIDEASGAVLFRGVLPDPLPWSVGEPKPDAGELMAFPRSAVSPDLVAQVKARASEHPTALVVPRDVVVEADLGDALVLRCPDRLADLDQAVEQKLLTARISRG